MNQVVYIEIDDITNDGTLKPYVTRGKPVVLMAKANFCGHCRTATPALDELAEYNDHIIVAAIVADGEDSEKQASKFISKWYSEFVGYPSYLGFDSNGKFKKAHDGGRDVKSLEKFCKTL